MSEVVFLTAREKLTKNLRDLYETLDTSDVVTASFFISKCQDYVNAGKVALVIGSRDQRLGHEGRTLLHNAAQYGNLPAVNFLLQQEGSSVMMLNSFDSSSSLITPLMLAISANAVDVAVVLIASGAKLNLQDKNGENIFHFAARMGSSRTLKRLVEVSQLSGQHIQALATTQNIKLKFPEDLSHGICHLVLVSY